MIANVYLLTTRQKKWRNTLGKRVSNQTRGIVVKRLGYRFLPGRLFGPGDVSQRERYSENGRQQNRKTVGARRECTRPTDVHETAGVGSSGASRNSTDQFSIRSCSKIRWHLPFINFLLTFELAFFFTFTFWNLPNINSMMTTCTVPGVPVHLVPLTAWNCDFLQLMYEISKFQSFF